MPALDPRDGLRIPAAAVQVPIGIEGRLECVVDLVRWRAIYNKGTMGVKVAESDEIPTRTLELAAQKRTELIEQLAKVDDEIAELLLNATPPRPRHNSLPRSGYMAVQTLLDNVRAFFGSSAEREVVAHDPQRHSPLAALAFKLQEGPFGKLAYMRVYQGTLKEGQFIFHGRSGKSIKVPKLVRIHGNDMENLSYDIKAIGPDEIFAIFGVECTSMFVPGPIISLVIQPISTETPNFSRALNQFQKEDPTYRVLVDHGSKETIIDHLWHG
ncbi:hypothetical protein BC826DRAFT_1110039 [Russula brevipes]|nr:hypothetical protein BC826DRAFT_1110039 [Russula brevipes]